MNKLGGFYDLGINVDRDLEQAARWLGMAAGKGDLFALEPLGDVLWALGMQGNAREAWRKAGGMSTEQAVLARLRRKQGGGPMAVQAVNWRAARGRSRGSHQVVRKWCLPRRV